VNTPAELSGRRALVTGGSRGIGLAVARELVLAGARVVTASRRPADGAGAGEEQAFAADLSDPASIGALLGRAAAHFGEADPIDILVNAAGDSASAPLARTADETWERMIAVNLAGPFRLMRAIVPPMAARGWGRVVTIASTAGRSGAPYISAYTASKHGVVGLTRSIAAEFAAKGVTVNAVCPGYVDTDMTARSVENISRATGRTREEALAAIVRQNPQGRLVTPAEVASLVLTLCLPSSAGINGQAIVLDGGGIQR
jgi:3-hydroxybutyrate dehydrogenase